MQVTLLDPAGPPGAGASASPQLLVQPMLMAVDQLRGAFARAAYAHALPRLRACGHWRGCGTLWLGQSLQADKLVQRLPKLGLPADFARAVDGAEAEALAGVPLPGVRQAVHSAASGWVDAGAWCRALADHPAIGIERRRAVEADIWAAGGGAHAPWLQPDRGQVLRLPPTAASAGLRCALHFGHYLFPSDGVAHTLGATHGEGALTPRMEDQAELLAALAAHLPALAAHWPATDHPGWVGYRWKTADGAPVVGRDAQGRWHLAGLGARGVPQALLGAELLADLLTGEPACVPADWLDGLGPRRFGK